MFGEQEVFFVCPYCLEQISMVFETLHGDQNYIEDCQVCCNPIEIQYSLINDEVKNVQAVRAQ